MRVALLTLVLAGCVGSDETEPREYTDCAEAVDTIGAEMAECLASPSHQESRHGVCDLCFEDPRPEMDLTCRADGTSWFERAPRLCPDALRVCGCP